MYWSYLINNNNYKNLLTFESNENFDKLTKGYSELVISDFFSSFSREYDSIIISEFDPTHDLSEIVKEIKFFIKFDDIKKAKQILYKN